MLALAIKNTRTRLTVKGAAACALALLSAVVPLIFHTALGKTGGITWLPMYPIVLLSGFLLGAAFGAASGALTPLISYCLSLLMLGRAMPALDKLPIMMAELAVFGAVSGAFSKPVVKNLFLTLPAVLLAQIAGRTLNFAISAIIAKSTAPLSIIASGISGLIVQILLVPCVVVCAVLLLKRLSPTSSADS